MIRIKNIKDSEKVYLKDKSSLPTPRKTILRDKIEIPEKSTRIKDSKGNLSFVMDICRDGIQEYLAHEIYDESVLRENEIDPNIILRLWRPPSVVFAKDAIAAHNGLPLTREHPSSFVDATNRAMLEKGFNRGSRHNPERRTISGVGFVTDPIMVMEIESDEYREISDGYYSEMEFKPGAVPDEDRGFPCTDSGMAYDLIMVGYTPNHIAIVKEGRAGNARIYDKQGERKMSFFDKLLSRDKKSKITDTVRKMDKASVLRALADEEPDEEKKAALEALADAEEEKVIDPVTGEDVQTDDSCGKSGDEDPTVAGNEGQPASNEGQPASSPKRVIDGTQNLEVLNMDITKEELINLISQVFNSKFKDADPEKDLVIDQTEPIVVEEFEVPDMQMDSDISAESLLMFAKTAGDPETANLARALASKIGGEAEPVEPAEQTGDTEPDDDGFIADADAGTEENRMEAASKGKAPASDVPSNEASGKDIKSATGDGDNESSPVTEKNGYFIPNKLADMATLPVLMGHVVTTVNEFGLEGIDVNADLQDGTIYHKLIDASGIGRITSPKGITEDRIKMAISAIRKNRQKVDGMSSLVNRNISDSRSGSDGFDPATEL